MDTNQTNQGLTVAFAVAFGIGFALLFAHPLAPLVPILVYFCIGFALSKSHRNTDRFADSLYYLGFLLTMCALAKGLVEQGAFLEQGSIVDTGALISALGTGLASSILGLVLRVFMIQLHTTVSDQDEDAKATIAAQAVEVEKAFKQLKAAWDGNLTDAQNLFKEFREFTGVVSEERVAFAARTKAMVESQEQALSDAVEKLSGKLQRVEVPSDLFVRESNAAFDQVAKKLVESLGDVKDLASGLRRAITEIEDEIRQLAIAGTVRGATDALVGQLDAVGKALEKSTGPVKKEFEELERSIGKFRHEADSASTSLANLSASVEGANRHISARAQAAGRSLEEVHATGAELIQQEQRTTRELEKVVVSVSEAGRKANDFVDSTDESKKKVEEAAIEAREALKGIGVQVTALEGDVRSVKSSLGELVQVTREHVKRGE